MKKIATKMFSKTLLYPLKLTEALSEIFKVVYKRKWFSPSESLLLGTYDEVSERIEFLKDKGVYEVMLYIPLLYEEHGVLEEYVEKILR